MFACVLISSLLGHKGELYHVTTTHLHKGAPDISPNPGLPTPSISPAVLFKCYYPPSSVTSGDAAEWIRLGGVCYAIFLGGGKVVYGGLGCGILSAGHATWVMESGMNVEC